MAMVGVKSLQGGRVLCSAAGATATVRQKHTLSGDQLQQQQQHQMHQVASNTVTSPAAFIPLPPNVQELQASEKARFSPRRTRDISSKLSQVGGVFSSGFMGSQGSQAGTFNTSSGPVDIRADVYDAHNTVSLSSVMQTNVPKPFEISGKAPVHLNMPGGQWAQDEKYVSGDLHTYHHSNLANKKRSAE